MFDIFELFQTACPRQHPENNMGEGGGVQVIVGSFK